MMKRTVQIFAMFLMVFVFTEIANTDGYWTILPGTPALNDDVDIEVGHDGVLWMVTRDKFGSISTANNGVYSFDGESWQHHTIEAGGYSNSILNVEVAPDGSVWVMSVYGISCFDGDTWESFPYAFDVGDFILDKNHLVIDESGTVWCSSRLCFLCFKDGVWTKQGTDDGLPYKEVTVEGLAASPDGRVCATLAYRDIDDYRGKNQDGQDVYGLASGTYVFSSDSWLFTKVNRISVITEDYHYFSSLDSSPDGSFWCSDGINIYQLDGDVWQPKYREYYLGENVMAVDSRENIWCSMQNGIAYYDGESLTGFTTDNGFQGGEVIEMTAGNNADVYAVASGKIYYYKSAATSVEMETPRSIILRDAFPNPFNGATTISYSLTDDMPVSLLVYNCMGQKIRSLIVGIGKAGTHSVVWNGESDNGMAASSGVYFMRLEAGNVKMTRKVMFIQ